VSAEPSIIGNVVGTFQATLNLAEEALVHAREAESRTRDAFVFYRQAFGDSQSSVVKAASAEAESSLALTQAGLAALHVANQAIRDFSLAIAPSLSLSESSEPRDSPSGEQLLDTAKRPRNLEELANTVTREGKGAGDVIKKAQSMTKQVIDVVRPPDPSGLSTVTQSPSQVVARPAPGVAGSGDPVLSVVVVVAVFLKTVQSTVSRFENFLHRRSSNES
jgi:hypothetical protein